VLVLGVANIEQDDLLGTPFLGLEGQEAIGSTDIEHRLAAHVDDPT
jgi:hypothetical protein